MMNAMVTADYQTARIDILMFKIMMHQKSIRNKDSLALKLNITTSIK